MTRRVAPSPCAAPAHGPAQPRGAATLALALALLALAGLTLPGAATAEGARLTLDCGAQRSCTEAGQCDPLGGSVRFTLAPVATDAEGTGDWTATQGDTASPARGLSHTGPWLWQPGDGHQHTLALTGDGSAIWIRQWLPTERYPETYAEIDFLLCEVTG